LEQQLHASCQALCRIPKSKAQRSQHAGKYGKQVACIYAKLVQGQNHYQDQQEDLGNIGGKMD
jgi:hypothetical protein